jgi:hypothetical protein
MSIRRFTIEACEDCSVILDIDLRLMTPETATEVNSFWMSADRVLQLAQGDAVRAVALRAAQRLIHELIAHSRPELALENLSAEEGWPRQHGISIVSFEIPDIDLHFMQILEESVR